MNTVNEKLNLDESDDEFDESDVIVLMEIKSYMNNNNIY